MQAKPTKEHEWLRQLVGEWTFVSESPMGANHDPMTCTGVERVRAVGGLWIVAEANSDMPNIGSADMLLTLGFDPVRSRFVGTWVGSMMTHLWVYDGELDASGKTLTLYTQGPDMCSDASKTATYKEVLEIISDNERTFTSHQQLGDDEWRLLMTARYTRTT